MARTAVNVIDRKLHTRKGKNALLYMMCFLVAFMFWVFISLDETTERDYEVPVKLVNVPDSVVLVGNVPQSVNVTVKGKGTQFVRYTFTGVPVMTIDFRQYNTGGKKVWLSRAKVDSRLREVFGQGVSILAVNPDSIKVSYATGSGYRLPLHVIADVSSDSRSIISGPIEAAIDSVSVYTVSGRRPDVSYVETEGLVRKDLADTLVCDVAVKQLPGMHIKPEKVEVKVPVELLVSKKRNVPVKVVNLPVGLHMITYPAAVEISYLVPMRLGSQEAPISAVIDYNTLRPGSRNAKVDIRTALSGYKIVSVSQDSVEYVIER